MLVHALPSHTVPAADAAQTDADDPLRATAQEFETVFVRQMLSEAGLAEAFGTTEGPMADAFSTILLDHMAEAVADKGGFGLADRFYEAMAGGETETETGTAGVRL